MPHYNHVEIVVKKLFCKVYENLPFIEDKDLHLSFHDLCDKYKAFLSVGSDITLSELKKEVRSFFGRKVIEDDIGAYQKFRYPKEFTLHELIHYVWERTQTASKREFQYILEEIEDDIPGRSKK